MKFDTLWKLHSYRLYQGYGMQQIHQTVAIFVISDHVVCLDVLLLTKRLEPSSNRATQ